MLTTIGVGLGLSCIAVIVVFAFLAVSNLDDHLNDDH